MATTASGFSVKCVKAWDTAAEQPLISSSVQGTGVSPWRSMRTRSCTDRGAREE